MIITDAFQAEFMRLGGENVAAETYASGDADFTAQLTAIKEANPDVIFFASWPPAVPQAMKQARDMGITATFIGGDGWDEETLLTTLDDNAPLEGGFYTANFSAQVPAEYAPPKAPAFVEAYTAQHGQEPGGITAVGYDGMHLIAIAIETAQSTDPVMIRDELATLNEYSGATHIYGFENQIAEKELVINTIKNGKIMLVPMEDMALEGMDASPAPDMPDAGGETSGENAADTGAPPAAEDNQ